MEKSNKLERSDVWHNIYEVLARLDLKKVKGDSLDRPSAATEIEEAVKKLLPIHNVSERVWKVDEIISVLETSEDADEHARWFDKHGR